jgi:hypothetical protein
MAPDARRLRPCNKGPDFDGPLLRLDREDRRLTVERPNQRSRDA